MTNKGINNGLVLQLIHGRSDPCSDLQNWGFDAKPISGVAYLHGTYLSTFTIGFTSEVACKQARLQTGWTETDDLVLEVSVHQDLIHCNDGYYGDFEIYQAT